MGDGKGVGGVVDNKPQPIVVARARPEYTKQWLRGTATSYTTNFTVNAAHVKASVSFRLKTVLMRRFTTSILM